MRISYVPDPVPYVQEQHHPRRERRGAHYRKWLAGGGERNLGKKPQHTLYRHSPLSSSSLASLATAIHLIIC
jgi:hypothetical protein